MKNKKTLTEAISSLKKEDSTTLPVSTDDELQKIKLSVNGLDHLAYSNIPDHRRIDKFTSVGIRVQVAGIPMSHKVFFVKYYEPGTRFYPRGGIKVYNDELGQTQDFYYESVILHKKKEMRKVPEV